MFYTNIVCIILVEESIDLVPYFPDLGHTYSIWTVSSVSIHDRNDRGSEEGEYVFRSRVIIFWANLTRQQLHNKTSIP